MKTILTLISKTGMFLMLFLFIVACKKEKCQQCYLDETNSQTGNVTTTNLGKKCGSDLTNTDGKQYIGVTGPVKSYCK